MELYKDLRDSISEKSLVFIVFLVFKGELLLYQFTIDKHFMRFLELENLILLG